MSNENMTWQEVCRELLRLDAEGYEKPWREFEQTNCPEEGFVTPSKLGYLLSAATNGFIIRLKTRTVRVTTQSGETLELPEPWWDSREGDTIWFVDGLGLVIRDTDFVW